MNSACSIRVFVRNKSRYNPETTERKFLYVDISDFAGTTVGEVKENVRRQCRGSLRIDELFLDNLSLADDRSVAHYNLEDGCILETTSNPLWVSCLYIKASEIKHEMEGNPNDSDIQKWTLKSLPKKYTLIGLLLNSKNEYSKQPPHFATLDDFATYLERLKKKGATMHPHYTQKDMRAFEREYRQEFVSRYEDPIAAFIDHHAVRLGLALPDEIAHRPMLAGQRVNEKVIYQRVNNNTTKPRGGGRKKQEKFCDDCEEALAEVYCRECQGGLAMCRSCSNVLHAGASRRRHNLQDIDQAPTNTSKPYIPRAFLAPFSIVLAMFSALSRDSKLSLTEDEIKRRAQPLTDTDLQDKQAGKYVGGFDCMENVLMNKGLVKKEAARISTYALSISGQALGRKLYTFYNQFCTFMESCRLPKLQNKDSASFRTAVINNRKLCLIIDENERDKQRLLRYANEKNIDAQVRLLPAGDYVWVLTPPMVDTSMSYTGRDYENELVLPFVVERKSWEDFENSTNSTRFKRQINNMLGSGLTNCFYLMEGSTPGLKNNSTHHHQQHLKGLLEMLMTENGFYINYTSSWMKSAQWLLWFTGLLSDGCRTGLFGEGCISYQEFMSRVGRQRGNTAVNTSFTGATKYIHTWKASLFVDHIIRDSQRERTMMITVGEDLLGVTNNGSKHLLVIQDLEQYNKKRQAALNKCCEAVYANPDCVRDIVEEKLGPVVHNMLHYDIASYWQLYIQIMTGVYVVRTETVQDTEKICRIFTSAPRILPSNIENGSPLLRGSTEPRVWNRGATTRKKPTCTVTTDSTVRGQDHISNDLSDAGSSPRHRYSSTPHIGALTKLDKGNTLDGLRKANIHSVYQSVNQPTSPANFFEDNLDENTPSSGAGYVIKKGDHDFKREKRKEVIPKQETIQPFSGKGYCLGTNYVDTQEQSHNSCVRNINNVQNSAGNSSHLPGGYQPGLVGGMWNSQNSPKKARKNSISNDEGQMVVRDTEKLLHYNTDFVDSQNEENVLKKVIEKSAREVNSMSCEASSLPENRGSYEIKSDVDLIEEEQLKHILELSKFDTGRLESENKIHVPVSNKIIDFDVLAEEEMLRHAIEMSMVEDSNDLSEDDVKLLPSVKEDDDIIVIEDTEENQDKQVFVKKRKETPRKIRNRHNSDGPVYVDGTGSVSCKRKIDEFQRSDIDLTEGLDEEDQLNLSLALEMSMTPVIEKNNCSRNKITTKEYGLSPYKKPRLGRDDIFLNDEKSQVIKNEIITFEQKSDILIDDTEVIEIDSQNSQANETENLAIDLVSNCDSDPIIENNSSNSLILEENERNCNASRSLLEDSDKACSMNIEDIDFENMDRDSSDKNELVNCSFTAKSDDTQETSLDTPDTGSFLKDNGDTASTSDGLVDNDTKGIEDNDYIPPSPERISSSSVTFSQSFFSNTPDTVDQRNKSVQSPIVKSFNKETLSKVPSECKVVEEIDSSHKNCAIVNDKFTKDERNEDCERDILEESGDEEKQFDLKTSLFYNSSDSEYDSEEDIIDKCNDDNDEKIDLEINPHLTENRGVQDTSESASVTVNSSKNESRSKFIETKEDDFGVESGDVSCVSLQMSKSENCDTNESVENIVTSNSDTEKFPHTIDRTRNITSDSRELEDENSKVLKIDGNYLEDMCFDNDDANDHIDFQPDSQDIGIKSVSDSEEDKYSDLEENCLDNNDPDVLPVIGRPRRMRYRELKEESEQKYRKLQKEMELEKQLNDGNGFKTEVTCDNDNAKSDLTADELFARQVQEDLDREAEQIEAQRALIDDAYIARQLHETLNKHTVPSYQGSPMNNPQSRQNVQVKTLVDVEPHRENECASKFVSGARDKAEISRDVNVGNSETVVRELQRREFEKIDNWRKMLQLGEKLANNLKDIDNENTTVASSQVQPLGKFSQTVEPSFKKIVAQHKASREKALAQLKEYRSIQMRRFQQKHGGVHQSTSSTQSSHSNNFDKDDVIILDEPSDFPIPKTCGTPNRDMRPSLNCHGNAAKLFDAKNHSSLIEYQSSEQSQKANSQFYFDHVNQPIQSQSFTGSHVSTSSQSKRLDADHIIQSTPVKHLNVTCGNCGEKGHTRTFTRCSKYHTAEESARREAKLEKQRQQKEEKQKQEVETIHMLSEHRRVLEEMTSQIQREMGTIQSRLQQRATELESQVNSRVRKIESANRKKKK